MKQELSDKDFNISCTVSMFNVRCATSYKNLCEIGFIEPKDFGVNILLVHVHRATVLPNT